MEEGRGRGKTERQALLNTKVSETVDGDLNEENDSSRALGGWKLVHVRRGDGGRPDHTEAAGALPERGGNHCRTGNSNSDVTEEKGYLKDACASFRPISSGVQDEERRRIARELHDSTGQKLNPFVKIGAGFSEQAKLISSGQCKYTF